MANDPGKPYVIGYDEDRGERMVLDIRDYHVVWRGYSTDLPTGIAIAVALNEEHARYRQKEGSE